eukprot:11163226-Alexandrium_andersonii.AAC.1
MPRQGRAQVGLIRGPRDPPEPKDPRGRRGDLLKGREVASSAVDQDRNGPEQHSPAQLPGIRGVEPPVGDQGPPVLNEVRVGPQDRLQALAQGPQVQSLRGPG